LWWGQSCLPIITFRGKIKQIYFSSSSSLPSKKEVVV
jgi:hypothetical protein